MRAQLIDDFLPDIEFAPLKMSGRDKLRVVVEGFLGGWFIPGSKWPRHEAA
jgi:hypothetical protein